LGTLLAAQLRAYILKDIPDFYGKVQRGEFEPVKEWLREKVHIYGSVYPPKELLERSFGEGLNPKYFIEYLREKYLG